MVWDTTMHMKGKAVKVFLEQKKLLFLSKIKKTELYYNLLLDVMCC